MKLSKDEFDALSGLTTDSLENYNKNTWNSRVENNDLAVLYELLEQPQDMLG